MRRALVAIGVVVVLGAGLAVAPRLVYRDGADYTHVASIAETPAYQDPALLARAWALPVAARYRGGFESQGNATSCGPTTAVDVLHSFDEAASQASILDGSGVRSFFGLVPGGVTLDQLAELLRRRGHRVTVLRDLTLEQLRAELAHANDLDRRYVVNFQRGPLFGRGGGHHSPIGGYLADRDLVFVLDVNVHYGPWLVPTARLFEAIDTLDPQSGHKRGLLRVE